MNRRVLLLAVLLAGLGGLAGCLGDEAPQQLASSDNSSKPTPAVGSVAGTAAVEGCVGYSTQVPLPWDAVEQALPDGFQPAPFVPVSVGPVTPTEDRAAEGFFDGWRCQQATVGNASLGEVTFVFAKIEVKPPSELAPPDEASSYVPLFLAADAPRFAEAFEEWGLAAESGQPTVETLGAGPTRAGHVQGAAPDTTLETRVYLADTPATRISASAEDTRYFVTEPALFQGDVEVAGVIERSTTNITGTIGQGHAELAGPIAQALGSTHAGLGFDSPDGSWGEAFRYRPVEAVR